MELDAGLEQFNGDHASSLGKPWSEETSLRRTPYDWATRTTVVPRLNDSLLIRIVFSFDRFSH